MFVGMIEISMRSGNAGDRTMFERERECTTNVMGATLCVWLLTTNTLHTFVMYTRMCNELSDNDAPVFAARLCDIVYFLYANTDGISIFWECEK